MYRIAVLLLMSITFCSLGCLPSPPGQPTGQGDTGPSVADFELLSYRTRRESGMLQVTGEIRNNGKLPAAVEVQVVARDRSGVAIESISFFPADSANIQPGGSRTFTRWVTDDTRATGVTVDLVRVLVW